MRRFLPALLLASTPAFAQITPQDVINDWRSYFGAFDGTVSTGTPVVTGATTRYNNIEAEMEIMETEVRYQFDWVEMRNNGDGTLEMTVSPRGVASSLANLPNGDSVESLTSYDLARLTAVISGAPDEITYAYSAPRLSLQQSQQMPGGALVLTSALDAFSGNSVTTRDAATGTLSTIADFSADTLRLDASISPPGDAPIDISYVAAGFASDVAYSLPSPGPSRVFLDGMEFKAAIRMGETGMDLETRRLGGVDKINFTQASGALGFGFDGTSMTYSVVSEGGAFEAVNTVSTLPVAAGFERASFAFALPLRKSETPVPFSFAFALANISLGDDIWALFDPEATLSRAPASFEISVAGTMQLFVDLLDRSAMDALRNTPFELRSLSLSSLSLDVEGAGLNGAGDLSFNAAAVDPATGMPEPLGALDFTVTGALGLLDKIGRLGFADPMLVIGAKGTLGMFGSPGSGPDSFTSRIEFSEGGRVSINGQQVK